MIVGDHLTSWSHPDRDAQFEHINRQVRLFQRSGQPIVSVDTKKRELIGDFKNGHALAAQRQTQRISVDEQARRLGLNLELLARLALCRTPRPAHYRPDLEHIARFVGVTAEDLQQLLADADPVIDLDALGQAVDAVLCAICHRNPVDAANGYDTCPDCLRRQ